MMLYRCCYTSRDLNRDSALPGSVQLFLVCINHHCVSVQADSDASHVWCPPVRWMALRTQKPFLLYYAVFCQIISCLRRRAFSMHCFARMETSKRLPKSYQSSAIQQTANERDMLAWIAGSHAPPFVLHQRTRSMANLHPQVFLQLCSRADLGPNHQTRSPVLHLAHPLRRSTTMVRLPCRSPSSR
jgi:hypothetical protein